MKESEVTQSQLFAMPLTVVYHAPPSMGFYRQEYWSGLPFPSPGDLPDPGIKPGSPTLQADSTTCATKKVLLSLINEQNISQDKELIKPFPRNHNSFKVVLFEIKKNKTTEKREKKGKI